MDGHTLTPLERVTMTGLLSREREIQREYLTPYQEDFSLFLRSVEERMGLNSGAIGSTHLLKLDDFTIVEAPKDSPSKQPGQAEPATSPDQTV